jgi:hypothetical protein
MLISDVILVHYFVFYHLRDYLTPLMNGLAWARLGLGPLPALLAGKEREGGERYLVAFVCFCLH